MSSKDSKFLKCQFCERGFESTYKIIPHIYFSHQKKIYSDLRRDSELLLHCPVTSCAFKVPVPDMERRDLSTLESTWTTANFEKIVGIELSKMLEKFEDHLISQHTREEKLVQCPYCQEDLAGQIYWVHLEKHLDRRWITKSKRQTKAGSKEERNVSPNIGKDGPARQEKSPRAPVIKLPVLVEETGGRIVEETGGKIDEPILDTDRNCSARQEKSPRESPSTPQSPIEVTGKRSGEDAGDGRVEDLGVRNNVEVEDQLTLSSSDDDGCELTIVSVESVVGTPSPVPSISRPTMLLRKRRQAS